MSVTFNNLASMYSQQNYGGDDHQQDAMRGEFFVNCVLDSADTTAVKRSYLKEQGRAHIGRAGSLLGDMLFVTTGGGVISDAAMPDSMYKAVDRCVRDVMSRQGWDCHVSIVMMPPHTPNSNAWVPYRPYRTGIFMGFRVQMIRKHKGAGLSLFDCCCPPRPPVYNQMNGYRIAPEIQQALACQQPPLHAFIECANAQDMVQVLLQDGLSRDQANMAVMTSRGNFGN